MEPTHKKTTTPTPQPRPPALDASRPKSPEKPAKTEKKTSKTVNKQQKQAKSPVHAMGQAEAAYHKAVAGPYMAIGKALRSSEHKLSEDTYDKLVEAAKAHRKGQTEFPHEDADVSPELGKAIYQAFQSLNNQ